jgi:hypothetical protein
MNPNFHVKRLITGLVSALGALGVLAPPAGAVSGRAADGHACAHEHASPSCGAQPPGLEMNHNETLVRG